jgi:DNA-binding PadR family transcriptional regulator
MSVRHALLALLREGPKYGLQLREEFEARTGEVWPLNVGQVYTTVQRLERDGLVESDGTDDDDVFVVGAGAAGRQKRFRITPRGVEELDRWLRTPPDLSSPPRDELVMKVLVAIALPGVDPRDVIQVHRRHLVELMQEWTRLKEVEAQHDLSFALVVDAELFRLDSVIRWLDGADGRLRRAGVDQSSMPVVQSEPNAPVITGDEPGDTPALPSRATRLPKMRRTVGGRR